jgi:GTP-binding protein
MKNPDPQTLEEARILFAQPCDFVLAATDPSHFPQTQLPEIAFIGRSNVGKSSLINALSGRKALARASNTPGRTQQIVFFNLANRLMLVDLPGYGHADAPRVEKDHWNALVHHYIGQRAALRLVCLLIDSRVGTKANDTEMMNFLDRAAISYQVFLTKGDQIKALEKEAKIRQISAMFAKHPAAREHVVLTSSEKAEGIAEARALLAFFANAAVT